MELSVLSCFLIAVWYWVINCDLGNLGRALMNPCLNGVLFGLVFGDVVTGTIIGATINIMYISIAAVGANMPADDSLAACVAWTRQPRFFWQLLLVSLVHLWIMREEW